MKTLALICGIIIAAVGGAITYRAFFIEPRTSLIITNANIHEVPNTLHIACGLALLIAGALLAFFAARRARG